MKKSPQEYRNISPHEMSVATILKSAYGAFNRRYDLIHRTEGYKPAGSAAIYIKEQWVVTYPLDGATHGKAFLNLHDAQDYFETYTTPIVEQK